MALFKVAVKETEKEKQREKRQTLKPIRWTCLSIEATVNLQNVQNYTCAPDGKDGKHTAK